MADWVHCNSCYIQPGPSRSFLLTSCGHIFCQDCVSASAKDKCVLCGTKFSAIPLTSQMRPDIEMYFTDPKELLKKYEKNVLQVMEFQHGHRMRLFSNYKNFMAFKEDNRKLQGKCAELEKHVSRLREENDHLRCCLKQQNGRTISPQVPNGYHMQKANLCTNMVSTATCSKVSPNTGSSNFSITPNRITVRTPPVNGKLVPITLSGISSISNSGGTRGFSFPNSGSIRNGIDSPMHISPVSSLTSIRKMIPGQSTSTASPVSLYSTPPQYSDHEKHHSTPYRLSPAHYPIRLTTGNTLGLIRKATVSPYSPHENSRN